MLEHPDAIDAGIGFVVDPGAPYGLVSFGDGARHEQVPAGAGGIAADLDMAVQAVMDREGENAGRATEEAANRLPPFEAAERRAFPECVFGEEGSDAVGVVLGVAQGGVLRLEVAYGFGVFQGLEAPFDLFELGQGITFVTM